MGDDRRCLVVDGEAVVRLGVREVLAETFEVEEASDWTAAKDLLTEIGDFEVAVVDIDPHRSGEPAGATLIKAIRRVRPSVGIVARARRAERRAASEALDAGARAFVVKASPPQTLRDAAAAAADRDRFVDPAAIRQKQILTKRQREILQLLADGHSTSTAAKQLALSSETIRTHTKAILARLEARDRTHAVAIGLRGGLID